MNFSPEDSKLLHLWQSLHFECETDCRDEVELYRQVDSLRSLMKQIDSMHASSAIDSTSRDHLLHQYSDKYRQLVDEQDTDKGLNNFAEPVLSLVAGHKNDSQNWKSSLSLDKIRATPTWKDIITKHETEQQSRHLNAASSSTRQVERYNDDIKTPQETKKKDWTMTLNTNDYSNQSKTNPGVSWMDDGGCNKRKLHSIYPPEQPEPSIVKSSGNQGNIPNPLNSGIAKQTENIYKRVPFDGKNTSNIQQSVERFSSDGDDGNSDGSHKTAKFITAKQQYMIDCKTKKQRADQSNRGASNYGNNARKTLGTRRGPSSKFIPPVPRNNSDDEQMDSGGYTRRKNGDNKVEQDSGLEPEMDERLKNIEAKMVELIMNEIMDHGPPVTWDDIAGLEFAKNVIKEIVVWPMLRPDIFKGLRGPPKGLLLFGPPGTGKTLIGKCIASQSKATFFSISASSLTSKWVGEGEKMVRALFAVARCHLPAVIFIDEIDSLLTQRTDGEHEASRRIKTEFLVQLDGATTNTDERLLVVGATNRPQEIDEAARRRLVKRLYIPLPDAGARHQIICNLLSQQSYNLSNKDIDIIVTQTDGYSGSDMSNLCREAAIGPIRCIASSDIEHITADQVRPIELRDFKAALSQVRASVSDKDLDLYIEWNNMFGSGSK